MSLNKLLILLYLFTFNSNIHAQSVLSKQWDKRFGGVNTEAVLAFQQTKDGGYICGGFSNSGISGNKTQDDWDTTYITNDFWVVKVDSLGNMEWNKRYGGLGEDGLFDVKQSYNGNYFFGGTSFSDIGGDKTQNRRGGGDYWIIKTDIGGHKLWDRRFGGTLGSNNLNGIAATKDGGCLAIGESNCGIGGDKTQNIWGSNSYYDGWIIKIDSLGNKQWDMDYGGTENDDFNCVLQTKDGGYVLGGTSNSDNNGDKSQTSWNGSFDYWIVRIDSVGNKLWDKRYGGENNEGLYSMRETYDKGFIIGGTSESDSSGDKTENKTGYWIIKVDSLGNKEWDKAYSGDGGYIYLLGVVQTIDSGFLVSGVSAGDVSDDKTENSSGITQLWIIKTDQEGNRQWDKTIFTSLGAGGSAIQSKDGCYIISASTSSGIGGYKSQTNWDIKDSTGDFWMIKFCMDTVTSVDESQTVDHTKIQIYPNPFATDISIRIQKGDLKQAEFTITNMVGQIVYTRQETGLTNNYTKMLDLSYLPNGIYMVQVVVDGEEISKKIIKQ